VPSKSEGKIEKGASAPFFLLLYVNSVRHH